MRQLASAFLSVQEQTNNEQRTSLSIRAKVCSSGSCSLAMQCAQCEEMLTASHATEQTLHATPIIEIYCC
jgi:hypothetical protein